ncbi:MAG: ABC transporter permease [Bacteroidota bacterium]
MHQNYFKIAVRHLSNHKMYVAINTIGLSLGLAGCIISYLLWQYDAEFDLFHTKAQQLYRVNTIKTLNQETYGVAPAPLAALTKANIAGVEDAIAMDFSWEAVRVRNQNFNEDVLFTEGNFLDWFDFELAEGTTHIADPSTVLLTEKMVKKYFGKENPIGQKVTMYSDTDWQKDLIVTGVIRDYPKNSSIHFHFITNYKNKITPNGNALVIEDWKQWREGVFLAVGEALPIESITRQLNQYVEAHQAALPDFNTLQFSLSPLAEMAQHSSEIQWNNFRYDMPSASIWSNIVSCILLLLAACLNFANMSVSLSSKRLKEIGVRKVMGSSQKQLIGQLLAESFLVCLLALVIALGVTDIWADWINRMWSELDLQLVLTNMLA